MLFAVNEVVTMPRINKRQINCVNINTQTPKEYYRVAIATYTYTYTFYR